MATKCPGCGVTTRKGSARHTFECPHMRAAILDADRREKRYNGWRNYETWCVNLWIDNEQALYEERRERVQAIIRDNVTDNGVLDRDAAVGEVATWLKVWISDEIPENYFPDTVDKTLRDGAMYGDLLGAALSEVDWHEIAEHDVDNEKDEIIAEIEADAQADAESEG